MATCEKLSVCPFFNDKMTGFPGTAASIKQSYCQKDNSNCARFMVLKALGKSKVPADLFPNQQDRAKKIIAEG